MTTSTIHGAKSRFRLQWFLGWTTFSLLFILAALTILSGMSPPQPFLIYKFNNPDFGRLALLALIAVTLIYSFYFLIVAALPRVAPQTSPAGKWLIVGLVFVVGMTLILVSASASHQPGFLSFSWTRLLDLFRGVTQVSLAHETLATLLLLSLALALSTATVLSSLTTALSDCTEQENETIRSFLLWMHLGLALIVLIYSVLLVKTALRQPPYANGTFIAYFLLLYLLVAALIFVVPALRYNLFSKNTAFLSFAGISIPQSVSSLLSNFDLTHYLPDWMRYVWNLV